MGCSTLKSTIPAANLEKRSAALLLLCFRALDGVCFNTQISCFSTPWCNCFQLVFFKHISYDSHLSLYMGYRSNSGKSAAQAFPLAGKEMISSSVKLSNMRYQLHEDKAVGGFYPWCQVEIKPRL